MKTTGWRHCHPAPFVVPIRWKTSQMLPAKQHPQVCISPAKPCCGFSSPEMTAGSVMCDVWGDKGRDSVREQICYCSFCPTFFNLPFPHSVWVQGRLGAPKSCCWRSSHTGQKITGTGLLLHELPSQTPLFSSIPPIISPFPFHF